MVSLASRVALVGIVLLAASGCQSALNWGSSTPAPAQPQTSPVGNYTVRAGDTLFGIAWRHGLDHRDLARWNRLGSGTFITPGQRIRLTPPAAEPGVGNTPQVTKRTSSSNTKKITDTPPPAWVWPTGGRIVAEFDQGDTPRTGVLLGGSMGDAVKAAAAGKVVYAGSGLIGYGQLLIVKHNESFLSAYGHNDKLLVAEGDTVAIGQRIARMGRGPEQTPALHFEIRRNGKPVNPRRLMPPR